MKADECHLLGQDRALDFWGLNLDPCHAALPTLDVNEGALDTIFSLYKRMLPQMGGYLVHEGRLNPHCLEILLAQLAELELETLEQRASVRS